MSSENPYNLSSTSPCVGCATHVRDTENGVPGWWCPAAGWCENGLHLIGGHCYRKFGGLRIDGVLQDDVLKNEEDEN